MDNKKQESAPAAPKEEKSPIQEERLQLLKSRLAVAKSWAKKRHEAWRKWIAEYEIENFNDTAEIRDKVRIGYIFRKTEQEIPAIFDDQPDLFIKGKIKDFRVIESVYNSAYDYLWDTQNLEEKVEDVGVYFELLGMGFMGSPWETKTEKVSQPALDPMGQPLMNPDGTPAMQEYDVPVIDRPNAEAKDPFKLFFSPETKFNYVLDAEHCPYYFEEQSWIKEKVLARFNKDVDPTEKLFINESGVDQEITEITDSGKTEMIKDDMKRVAVYEYYGTLPEKMATDITDENGDTVDWTYDKEYHIFLTKNEELLVEECPYPIKPLFMVGNYGLANKFWKFGDAKHLMPLVQELEMYRSQILQHTRKMANPKPLIHQDAEVDEEIFNDPRVGKTVKWAGVTPPSYLSPAQLGREVETGINQARTDLEKTSPSFDLNGGGGQSQVKTPRGIATFSEAADRGTRRKRKKIARFIRTLITFQFLQLSLNWKPDENKKLEVDGKEEPITQEVLQVLGDRDLLRKVDIETESLSINRVQMKQDSLDLFDLASKFPQIFNLVEVARDLLQNGFNKRDADRYLVSMDQINKQAIQGFIQHIGQANPELAAQLMQYMQQPNMTQIQQNQSGATLPTDQTQPTPPTQPDNGMGPMPQM